MWSYDDIDVYLSPSDNILGETSVATQNWVPLSTYGLLRSRVALTPSTVEGNSLSIPGKDGKSYAVDSGRGNAKLDFEVLVADEWVHKTLNSDVRTRTDTVVSLLNRAFRIAYKQPGRTANSYFIIYKTTLTINDADELVSSIKVQMEVHPFEFFFDGNTKIEIAANGTYTFSNPLPYSACNPSVVFPEYTTGYVTFNSKNLIIDKQLDPNTVVDSFKNLAYLSGTLDNKNDYFVGNYKSVMLLPGGATSTIANHTSKTLYLYTRKGITK